MRHHTSRDVDLRLANVTPDVQRRRGVPPKQRTHARSRRGARVHERRRPSSRDRAVTRGPERRATRARHASRGVVGMGRRCWNRKLGGVPAVHPSRRRRTKNKSRRSRRRRSRGVRRRQRLRGDISHVRVLGRVLRACLGDARGGSVSLVFAEREEVHSVSCGRA